MDIRGIVQSIRIADHGMIRNKKTFTAQLELKNLGEDGLFEGYASVFGVTDSDGDIITKGAFRTSIQKFNESGRRPKMLWMHNPSIMIGKWVDVREDSHGLLVKGSLILDVEKGREAYALMKAGELDAMSVGFNIDSATQGEGRGRVIDEADLWEISLVTWGANPDALISTVKTAKEFEAFLRDSGFSRKEATTIASRGFKAIDDQSDSESVAIDEMKTLIRTIKLEANHG
jgi:hypothetical protein